ncbi:MAG: glutamine synthetase III [Clostridia bacterium]|nr:glutamine synthetase III [Clostridia bacterium]
MNVTEIFGSLVFNDSVMKERLPKETYDELKKCIDEDRSLPLSVANVVAGAMKDWAVEHGVTHYTHWFQPMTGITAEKHDSFISPTAAGGVIMEFSGKELIKGESDASSFPSGGLRATFEARGYTAWDPTSFAFIKDGILCIPTAFCSYNGLALDKKTPLLRSMEAINKQAKRILKLFGKDVKRVIATVGPEQEYFLVDKKTYEARPDLVFTGRTLFGARAPKGQELEDHYFGAIKTKIVKYMKDLDEELWKLGILAKTKHNEAAPAQHELAPIFCSTSVATDHNQLTMEIMKKVALRHGMVCLLHEKPFAGVNGSGKHNNWSLATDDGKNLLEPGNNPYDNAQFLLFLSAAIAAVDEYQDLLRISVASAGNDHRLGANEAPPAIVSMFLGDELTGILEAIEEDRTYSKRAKCNVEIGVHVLPKLPQDSTDRNRTSPFAFTGNKFEFRMPGSSFSIAGINVVLNTIVAESLRRFADELEGTDDIAKAVNRIVKQTMKEHKRIIFNGNNYSEEWVSEAERRGLHNYKTTADALPHYTDEKNMEVFSRHGVFTEEEIRSRREIYTENYCKILRIEALTMIDMMNKMIMPAVTTYQKELTENSLALKNIGIEPNTDIIKALNDLYADGLERLRDLEMATLRTNLIENTFARSIAYRDEVVPAMERLRVVADQMELRTAKKYWPMPTYADLLFGINE